MDGRRTSILSYSCQQDGVGGRDDCPVLQLLHDPDEYPGRLLLHLSMAKPSLPPGQVLFTSCDADSGHRLYYYCRSCLQPGIAGLLGPSGAAVMGGRTTPFCYSFLIPDFLDSLCTERGSAMESCSVLADLSLCLYCFYHHTGRIV